MSKCFTIKIILVINMLSFSWLGIIISELKKWLSFLSKEVIFKLVCMLVLSFLRKGKSVIFFWELSSCLEIQDLILKYQKVSSKNDLLFQIKLSTERSPFQMIISYVELQLPIKGLKKISQVVKWLQITFFEIFSFFLIKFIAC